MLERPVQAHAAQAAKIVAVLQFDGQALAPLAAVDDVTGEIWRVSPASP